MLYFKEFKTNGKIQSSLLGWSLSILEIEVNSKERFMERQREQIEKERIMSTVHKSRLGHCIKSQVLCALLTLFDRVIYTYCVL